MYTMLYILSRRKQLIKILFEKPLNPSNSVLNLCLFSLTRITMECPKKNTKYFLQKIMVTFCKKKSVLNRAYILLLF